MSVGGFPALAVAPWPSGFTIPQQPADMWALPAYANYQRQPNEMIEPPGAMPAAPATAQPPGGVPRIGGRLASLASQFMTNHPRVGSFLENNQSALFNAGLALATTRRGEGGAVRDAVFYGQQQDQQRRDKQEADAQRAQSVETWAGLLQGSGFDEQDTAALQALLASPNPQDQALAQQVIAQRMFTPPASAEPTDDMREYQFAVSQGFQGTFEDWQHWQAGGAGDPTFGPIVTGDGARAMGLDPAKAWQQESDGQWHEVGGGGVDVILPDAPNIGTIPPGYEAWQDEQGRWHQSPVQGGPAETELAETAAAAEINAAWSERMTGTLTSNINRAVEIIQRNPGQTTGWGALLAALPASEARTLQSTMDTIRGLISVENLQAMRAASPTGGALGSITERELALLGSMQGALDPQLSPDILLQNLSDIAASIERYNEAVAAARGQGAGPAPALPGAPNTAAPTPAAPVAPAVGAPPQNPLTAPPVGTVEDGYRFTGGDPADPNNWQRVE